MDRRRAALYALVAFVRLVSLVVIVVVAARLTVATAGAGRRQP